MSEAPQRPALHSFISFRRSGAFLYGGSNNLNHLFH